MKHLPNIDIHAIPHKKQRYNTCGDYFQNGDGFHLRVSKMGADYEFLVALHELIEWYMTQRDGISIKDIDDFDMKFEKKRKKGNTDEPGDEVDAPYHKQHQFATYMEEQMAIELGVDWDKYEKHVNDL